MQNTAKWRKVRHVIEPEPDGKCHQHHVDPEDQKEPIPQTLDAEHIFYSAPHEPNKDVDAAGMEGIQTPIVDRDAEQMQADDAVDVASADVDGTGIEDDVAAMFMGDGDGTDFGC